MTSRFPVYFLMTVCLVFFVSCSEEQNFDQIDDLALTPTVASSIFSFEADEEFINSVPVVNAFYTQTFVFEAFSERFVAERLIEGNINYIFENTTSKPLNVFVEFLDEGGNVLDFEIFNLDPEPAPALMRQVEYGPNGKPLDILINTVTIRITGSNLGDNTSVSNASDPRVSMQSAAEFLFRLVE